MSTPGLHLSLTELLGEDLADQVITILDEQAAHRCKDSDCVRWWAHSRIARHAWRHQPSPPLAWGLLGPRCFDCGRYAWSRIHRQQGV